MAWTLARSTDNRDRHNFWIVQIPMSQSRADANTLIEKAAEKKRPE
jgi:hypothetical protein